MSNKKKYLQVFNYLKEFSELRSKSVRNIDFQENSYPEKIWLNDIPEDESFKNIIRENFNRDNDYWLEIPKPREPVEPQFAEPPPELKKWIDPSTLKKTSDEPKLHETIEIDGKTLSIKKFPQTRKKFEQYRDGKWLKDAINYNEKKESYEKLHDEYKKLDKVYRKLFLMYNRAQQFSEEYELVMGVGLLNFQKDRDSPKIFRHILTQRVEIDFKQSERSSSISITPDLESTLQIETDFILDLTEQFDPDNITAAEIAAKEYINEKKIDTVFDNSDETQYGLKMFAERVSSDGSYDNSIEKPNTNTPPAKPVILFSPALLLRKQSAKSFTTLYKKISNDIENESDGIEIPALNSLVGAKKDSASDFSDGESLASSPRDEPVLFPKEWNDEQIEIINKAGISHQVLVQGPPGTGKSHTIANLICHLLAYGKKVLITAYKKPALEVLKDKLPPEFQKLTVNFLGGDSSSVQDLESSVNSINEELSKGEDLNSYQVKIDELETRLKQTRESIAENTNKFIEIEKQDTRKLEINSQYRGTLMQVAEKLEADAPKHQWYQDTFDDVNNKKLLTDLGRFMELRDECERTDSPEFGNEIPNINRLPEPDEFTGYENFVDTLKKN